MRGAPLRCGPACATAQGPAGPASRGAGRSTAAHPQRPDSTERRLWVMLWAHSCTSWPPHAAACSPAAPPPPARAAARTSTPHHAASVPVAPVSPVCSAQGRPAALRRLGTDGVTQGRIANAAHRTASGSDCTASAQPRSPTCLFGDPAHRACGHSPTQALTVPPTSCWSHLLRRTTGGATWPRPSASRAAAEGGGWCCAHLPQVRALTLQQLDLRIKRRIAMYYVPKVPRI